MWGAVRDKWASQGWETGKLGSVSDDLKNPDGKGVRQQFQGGTGCGFAGRFVTASALSSSPSDAHSAGGGDCVLRGPMPPTMQACRHLGSLRKAVAEQRYRPASRLHERTGSSEHCRGGGPLLPSSCSPRRSCMRWGCRM